MKKIAFIILLIVGLACSSVYAKGFKPASPSSIPDRNPSTPRIASPVITGFTEIMNRFFCPETGEKNK
jgi:hypothetical protein